MGVIDNKTRFTSYLFRRFSLSRTLMNYNQIFYCFGTEYNIFNIASKLGGLKWLNIRFVYIFSYILGEFSEVISSTAEVLQRALPSHLPYGFNTSPVIAKIIPCQRRPCICLVQDLGSLVAELARADVDRETCALNFCPVQVCWVLIERKMDYPGGLGFILMAC